MNVFQFLMSLCRYEMLKNCPDCKVAPYSLHIPNCDIEQCVRCGGQLLSCCCYITFPADSRRIPWDGWHPGTRDAIELGWFAKRAKIGWKPCKSNEPGSVPDLNRLHTEATWEPRLRRFIKT